MALSADLVSQFAKLANNERDKKTEATYNGTVVISDGKTYVRLDGSEIDTPVVTTADVKHGERVTVMIKNHTAIITGNMSSPAARTEDVQNVTKVVTYEVTADNITAINGIIDTLKTNITKTEVLEAVEADIEKIRSKLVETDRLSANDMDVINADIENLKVKIVDTEVLEAVNADIEQLKAYTAEFTYVSTDVLAAVKANVQDLTTKKLSADDAELKYVNIDFTNIDKAWMDEFYAKSGLIEHVTMEDGTVTGHLVGVTITGDLIEGNTIVADKLVIQGDDGLYYKLNFESGNFVNSEEVPRDSLHGSIITAKSITADRISVSDLVAFDATIGGFHIGDQSIYSGVKESVDNTTRGIYQDVEGQFAVGDANNYIKYYKVSDEAGNESYKLEISAESILFGANSKSSAADLKKLTEHVKIGTYTDPETNNVEPSVELSEGDSDFKQILTSSKAMFLDGNEVRTIIDANGLTSENARIENELRIGEFVWSKRENGNVGIVWKGVTS